eukprot:6461032-Amphidinium_carterae.1
MRPSASTADTVTCCTNKSKVPLPDAFNFFVPSSALKVARADIGVESAEYEVNSAPSLCEATNSSTRSTRTNCAVWTYFDHSPNDWSRHPMDTFPWRLM